MTAHGFAGMKCPTHGETDWIPLGGVAYCLVEECTEVVHPLPVEGPGSWTDREARKHDRTLARAKARAPRRRKSKTAPNVPPARPRPSRRGWSHITPEMRPRGEGHCSAKLTAEIVRTVRRLASEGARVTDLARRFGVSRASMSAVIRRKTWAHVV